MTRIGLCAACKVGNHEKHRRIVKKSLPGRIGGGVVCGCTGDCLEKFQKYVISRHESKHTEDCLFNKENPGQLYVCICS